MKNELDAKLLLKVFDLIYQKGEDFEDGKLYQGITAFSDIDGYTIYLKGNGVLLRFGFHNTYHLDYEHSKLKDVFMSKLESLVKEVDQ